jgi:hypothetical protein
MYPFIFRFDVRSYRGSSILFSIASYNGESLYTRAAFYWLQLRTTMLLVRSELELLELIQTQMAQKPMLRAEVGMRVRCANKASAE